MNTAPRSYGDKVTAVRRAMAKEGMQMTAGPAREEGGRYAGGRVAGGSKPIALPAKASGVTVPAEQLEAARAMLAQLTAEERAACAAQIDAERRWEAGAGDRHEIERQAKRADEAIRQAVKRREAAGEQGEAEALTPISYLRRIMWRGGAAYTIRVYPYGFGQQAHIEAGGKFTDV